MKKVCLLLLIAFLFCNFNLLAQSKGSTKDKKAESSGTIDVFGNEQSTTTNNSNTNKNSKKPNFEDVYMLKIDIIQPLFGNIIFSLEKNFTNRFGAELSAGPTLSTALSDLAKLFDEFSGAEKGESDFGLYYGAQIKYYTDSYYSPEGFYCGLGFRQSTLKWKELPTIQFIDYSAKETKITEFLRITLGYTGIYDRFVSDWYLGIGIRQNTKSYYSYSNTIYPDKTSKAIGFTFGYKLGISF